MTYKTVLYAIAVMAASYSIGRMSLADLHLYGLIIAIPFTVYAIYMVLTLERTAT